MTQNEKRTNTTATTTTNATAATADTATGQWPHYTYLDCLKGITPGPQGANGAATFQVLMVGGMVTFMVTVNGLRHTGLEFIAMSHWLYPLMFCIAFLVRTFIGGKIAGALAPKLVLNRFEGTKRAVGMTVLNVCCMAPIMCAIGTLLLNGTENYLFAYITTLPIVMPIAMLVNYFIVGPIVKLLFNNKISPAGGISLLTNLKGQTDALTRLLGC